MLSEGETSRVHFAEIKRLTYSYSTSFFFFFLSTPSFNPPSLNSRRMHTLYGTR